MYRLFATKLGVNHMNLKAKIILFTVLSILIGSMVGCHKPRKVKWVYRYSKPRLMARAHELAQLRSEGVDVAVFGESVKIMVPDHLLFKPGSWQLKSESEYIVAHLVNYMRTFTVVKVNVNGYADSPAWSGASSYSKLRLTNNRANAVAKYLWSSGIDMRMIVPHGYGSQNYIAWNGTPKGRSYNNRIDIAFRYYPYMLRYN